MVMRTFACTGHDIRMWASDGVWRRAESGDAVAQYEVGEMYHHGLGTPRDPGKAIEWYLKAAEQGHLEAQFSVGRLSFLGAPEEPDSSRYANDDGSPKLTKPLPPDLPRAVQWVLKAADSGHAGALNLMGVMCFQGIGVTQDSVRALELWRAAAEHGFLDAFLNLGLAYEGGQGVAADAVEGLKWLLLAGDEPECTALRERLAGRLSPDELSLAQDRARAWRDTFPQDTIERLPRTPF